MTASPTIAKRSIADAAALALADLSTVHAVALFGSVARGDAGDHSDIDLLVLVEEGTTRHGSRLSDERGPLSDPCLSLSMCTASELEQRLSQWSRFAAHLRRESVILHDPCGMLTAILSTEVPLSTKHERERSLKYLEQFAHLDRFGGRMLFPLAHLYSIGRTGVLARLLQYGDLEFNQSSAFAKLKKLDPTLARDISTIESLAPFHDRVRSAKVDVDLPFDPYGTSAESRAAEAREAVMRVLHAGEAPCARS